MITLEAGQRIEVGGFAPFETVELVVNDCDTILTIDLYADDCGKVTIDSGLFTYFASKVYYLHPNITILWLG